MSIKVTYPQIKISDKPVLEDIVTVMADDPYMPYTIKYWEGQIVDEVFYPKHKTKEVYKTPEGYTIFTIMSHSELLPQILANLALQGIEFTLVPLTFL
jgi:hypothetical protein